MTKEEFLLEEKVQNIKQELISDGWITVCLFDVPNDYIYCSLVKSPSVSKYMEDDKAPINMGYEGHPTVYGNNEYRSHDSEIVEPLVFLREFSFDGDYEKYLDFSEEFVFYFKLYEVASSKENREYFFIDDYGRKDKAVIVKRDTVKIKLKYLKEYITIREMHLIISLNLTRLIKNEDYQFDDVKFKDRELIKTANLVYSHTIRSTGREVQSWVYGNLLIEPNKEKKTHLDGEDKYESFIVGYDDDTGAYKYLACNDYENEHYFTFTYFEKSVLEEYYNHSSKYDIGGFTVKTDSLTLKIDNNNDDYIPVLVRDLGILPHSEQLHWKKFNIPPTDEMGFSRAYYNTMIEGYWNEHPETPDLFFKYKYKDFNKKWEKKYAWKFHKELAPIDQHVFRSLHISTLNDIKPFTEQIISLTKLLIDRINEAELVKDIIKEEKDKGLMKLEKYLQAHNKHIKPVMMAFLRHLQNLRSGISAHSFSKSNKKCKRAMQYFNIQIDEKNDYIAISKEIFIQAIYTLNTLESAFKLDEN